MVRTKADNCAKKAVAAKAPRKVLGSSNSGGSSSSGLTSPSSSKAGRHVGGNSVCARPTPEWQKGISAFMRKLPDRDVEADDDGENQTGVEVPEDVTATDSGASSQTSSSSAGGVDTSGRRNGIVDSDED